MTTSESQGVLARAGLRLADWSERWFPDAFVFALAAVLLVGAGALAAGASPASVALQFGNGFWDLIPFTMQMAMVVIGGFVVATSPPVARAIDLLARIPRSGRTAVAFVAALSMATSLLSWGFSLIFGGLLVRALARRLPDMDYRAAGAAAYLGLGSIWALGLSSSAAQLQANPASLPRALLPVTGVLPYTETLFLWQSLVTALVLMLLSVAIAFFSAPSPSSARPAAAFGVSLDPEPADQEPIARPADRLERSRVLTLLVGLLGVGWLAHAFVKGGLLALSNLNTYNFAFLVLGMLLQSTPRRFLSAVARAVPATAGVLIQFPFYAGIAAILVGAKNAQGSSLSDVLAHWFVVANRDTFPLLVASYSALLGFFVPSGGGKWVIEAPYLMQAANGLHVHLGWTVQIYNAAEALPNLVNPFWMLPLMGLLRVKARELVGYSILQLLIHAPVVLFLSWLFAQTLTYRPPVLP